MSLEFGFWIHEMLPNRLFIYRLKKDNDSIMNLALTLAHVGCWSLNTELYLFLKKLFKVKNNLSGVLLMD